jgi:uncharacterized protein
MTSSYSSVGFGGGSSYLALLAQPFFLLAPEQIRPAALLCNIVVVTGGTLIFLSERQINFRKSWPLLIISIPMAYVGALWKISDHAFFVTLGLSLLVASLLLWIKPQPRQGAFRNVPLLNAGIGGAVGFLSGLVGIGGGIFLAPILHLIHWDETKKIAAIASLYILVNSVSGLAGILASGTPINWSFIFPLLVAVFIGGQIGSRLGARRFDQVAIKRITALLIFVASFNILRDHL